MNPYLLGLVRVLALMIGVVSAFNVLGFALRHRRPAVPALVVGALAFGVFGWAESRTAPGYDAGEIARIDALHRQFEPRLEAYRASHGEYPATLGEAGIAAPPTRYGPLRYEASRDAAGNPRYQLVVGDYVTNGFVSTWRSETGAWGLRRDD